MLYVYLFHRCPRCPCLFVAIYNYYVVISSDFGAETYTVYIIIYTFSIILSVIFM